MNVALIVFAGAGSRINSQIPKQFIKINNRELVSYTIATFNAHKLIDEIVLVTHKDYVDYVRKMASEFNFLKVKNIVIGGSTRQESVRNGLNSCNYKNSDNILIHDGDRPLVSEEIITDNIFALSAHDVVCTAIKHEDALDIVSNLGRTKLIDGEDYDIQTPQSFKFDIIKTAHNLKKDLVVSDDISLVEKEYRVYFVEGSKNNFKVTTDKDLEVLKAII